MAQEQEVVLISGCSAGIGHELAKTFAGQGLRVFATALRVEDMQGLEQLPGCHLLQLDVCNQGSMDAAVAAVLQRAGRIDILVNNAGVAVVGPCAEVPLDNVRAAFEVNVFGLLALTQAVVPTMAAQGSGKIINMGSLAGYSPMPFSGIYSATKGAVMRLTDALRVELAPLGVSVMLATPGFVKTRICDTAKDLATSYSSSRSLWTGWLPVTERAMAKLVAKGACVDSFARDLTAICLRKQLPRYWVGPCPGREWVVRFLPLWLQDWVTYRIAGLFRLEAVLQQNAAALPKRTVVRS